jgi:hypothetical protein
MGSVKGALVGYRLVAALMRPAMRLWLATAEMTNPAIPRPPSRTRVRSAGDPRSSVLLVGNGPAVGYGVLSHDLALAGHLGRQLAACSGRPTEVVVVADGTMTAGSARTAIDFSDLDEVEAVVMTIGINETLAFSPSARWESELEVLLDEFDSRMRADQSVCMVAIPPMGSIGRFPRILERAADRHAARLNQLLGELCSRHPRAVFVPFEPPAHSDSVRYRSSETYRTWASIVVGPVYAALERSARPRL